MGIADSPVSVTIVGFGALLAGVGKGGIIAGNFKSFKDKENRFYSTDYANAIFLSGVEGINSQHTYTASSASVTHSWNDNCGFTRSRSGTEPNVHMKLDATTTPAVPTPVDGTYHLFDTLLSSTT